MGEKTLLIIERGLINKIDENRHDLNRAEFVELCVNTCFKEIESDLKAVSREAKEAVYTGRERFEKYSRSAASPIIIESELIKRIDENRGDLSRARFVELCVDTYFGEVGLEPEKPREEIREDVFVSRSQFDRYQRSIKSLLRTFLDVFVTFGLSRERRDVRRLEAELRQSFRETMGDDEYEIRREPYENRTERRYLEDDYEPPLRSSSPDRRERVYAEDYGEPRRGIRRARTERRYLEDDYEPPLRSSSPDRRERVYAEDYGEPRRGIRRTRTERRYIEDDYEPPLRSSSPDRRERVYSEDYDESGQSIRQPTTGVKHRLRAMLGMDDTEPSRSPSPARSKRYYSEEYEESPPPPAKPIKNTKPRLEDDSDVAGEEKGKNMYPGLWIPAIALFGFGDTLLSTMVFARGGYEANPLMGTLVSMIGGNMAAFVIIKTVILALLAFISFKMLKGQGWLIPSILTAVGGYLVVSNIIAYMSLA